MVWEPLSVIGDSWGVKGLSELRSLELFGNSEEGKGRWIDLCSNIARSIPHGTDVSVPLCPIWNNGDVSAIAFQLAGKEEMWVKLV